MQLRNAAAGGASTARYERRLQPAAQLYSAASKAVLVRIDPSIFIRSRRAQMGELCMEGMLDEGMVMGSGELSMPVMTGTRRGNVKVWQIVGKVLIVVCVRGKSHV